MLAANAAGGDAAKSPESVRLKLHTISLLRRTDSKLVTKSQLPKANPYALDAFNRACRKQMINLQSARGNH